MKILVSPNSYKECADSVKSAELFQKYLSNNISAEFIKKPISDGGDGFLNVCAENFNLDLLQYQISTPFDDSKIMCEVGYDEERRIVYVESANVLGLKIIPKVKRHPINLSSKGMGELINLIHNDSLNHKIKVDKIVVGVGGTGTNDLGLGMCSQLGLKIFDSNQIELKVIPKNFMKAESIEWSTPDFPFSFEIIVDVDNPLLGQNGATMIFGAQKGSTEQELNIIENGFENILNLLKNSRLVEAAKATSGAGGGLAAGFILLLNAEKKMAYSFISDDLEIKKFGEHIDFIITGEGAFDSQSLMKKGTGIIVDLFSGTNNTIFLCCGKIDEQVKSKLKSNIIPIEISKYFQSSKESIENFEQGVVLACKEMTEAILN